VRARQHDDVARRLAQIHRFRAVGNNPWFGGEKMHSADRSPTERASDRGTVEALLTDHDETGRTPFIGRPRPVEMLLDAVADGLRSRSGTPANPFSRNTAWVRIIAANIRRKASGSVTGGAWTIKLSKSSWSCSPSSSCRDGRASKSSSAAAPRPSATAGGIVL